MAPTYRDRIQFCKVEIDENPVLVEKYVPDRSFHCLVIMKNGKVLGRKYGVDPDTEADPLLKDWLKKFVPQHRTTWVGNSNLGFQNQAEAFHGESPGIQ